MARSEHTPRRSLSLSGSGGRSIPSSCFVSLFICSQTVANDIKLLLEKKGKKNRGRKWKGGRLKGVILLARCSSRFISMQNKGAR